MNVRVLPKNVEIPRLTAYGREINVTSLFGCCARRATRLRKTERTGSLVSTESFEATPRDERYDGGGTNSVYESKFVRTASLADSVTCIVEFRLCCEGVLRCHVTDKKTHPATCFVADPRG